MKKLATLHRVRYSAELFSFGLQNKDHDVYVCWFFRKDYTKSNRTTPNTISALREHRLFQVHKTTTMPWRSGKKILKVFFFFCCFTSARRLKRTFNIYCLVSRNNIRLYYIDVLRCSSKYLRQEWSWFWLLLLNEKIDFPTFFGIHSYEFLIRNTFCKTQSPTVVLVTLSIFIDVCWFSIRLVTRIFAENIQIYDKNFRDNMNAFMNINSRDCLEIYVGEFPAVMGWCWIAAD